MTRAPRDHSVFELEPFFAAERELAAEPEDLRNRVIERAWASLERKPTLPRLEREWRPRRVKVGLAAAAAVLLSGMCALAFYAGYQVNRRHPDVSSGASTGTRSLSVQQAPAPSIVVAIVPVPVTSTTLVQTSPETAHTAPRVDKGTPGVSAKTIDLEAYTKELRVLQPARQAVAQGDYGSALVAIADHQSQFPTGKLTEEREALRVKALLGLGRTAEAQRAGASFRSRFPRSALTKRIDEMLGTQK